MHEPIAATETASAPAPRQERPLSLVVLGADVLLRARPASAVQLAHACQALGYHAVVPSSWGDELLAGACLDILATREPGTAVFCACPRVAHRLLASGSDLAPALISLVSPPVAVARYLRALYAPARVRITFVGGCPGAGEEALDARLSAQELFDTLIDHGIVLSEQPTTFDAVLPPDRRRHLSLPGGAPSADVLARDGDCVLREADGEDLAFALAQHLLEGGAQLLDVAPALGCACAGVIPGLSGDDPRAEVARLEPPRAASPVVDHRVLTALGLQLPLAARTPADLALPPTMPDDTRLPPGDDAGRGDALLLPAVAGGRNSPMRGVAMVPALPAEEPREMPPMPRRRSPAQGVLRVALDGPPSSRGADGRLLPRAYVARRKAGPWKRGGQEATEGTPDDQGAPDPTP
ncbi:MAG TPA: [Fe-Fe] hydrogenase large subunit C-terminal domain-containing protein [Gemmatimonadaceae bacterium]